MNVFKTSVKLACLAYKAPEDISKELSGLGLKAFEWIENTNTDTQCFVCADSEYVFVSVRGSSTRDDWKTNFSTKFIDFKYGRAHQGFWQDAGSVCVDVSCALIKHVLAEKKAVLTGHSQGAAVACCLGLWLFPAYKIHRIIHFGGPRHVDVKAANKIKTLMPGVVHRFVNNNDLVTRVPPRVMGYSHYGQLHYFKESGDYTTSISAWAAFLDRFAGKFTIDGDYVIDSLDDHDPRHYLRLVQTLPSGE